LNDLIFLNISRRAQCRRDHVAPLHALVLDLECEPPGSAFNVSGVPMIGSAEDFLRRKV
jgi:hypothetical protein